MTTSRANRPPKADFEIKPKYINPTNETMVRFINKSTYPGADPLTFTWLVDGQSVSQQKDYSTKLPVGQHQIQLRVSDGQTTASKSAAITVEPDQIYPTKPLQIKYKGMNYAAACVTPEFDTTPRTIPDHEELDEQLSTIHDELGCNAIFIEAGAGYEDKLIEACELAIQKGFDRIYVHAKYMHFTLDDTIDKLRTFAPAVTKLRKSSNSVVWAIGAEFTYAIKGIIPGDTFKDQQKWIHEHHNDYIDNQKANIPRAFQRILPIIKSNYDYPVAYAAGKNEVDLVPWGDPVFESICWNAYLQPAYGEDEQFLINKLSELRRFGKPIISSEFGSATYKGAAVSATTAVGYQGQPYDEDEQANSIDRYCKMLNRAPIDGAFVYIYNEEWDKGYGLYNGMQRKKGFYMYKSYALTNSSSTVKSESEENLTIPSLPLASNWLTRTLLSFIQIQSAQRTGRIRGCVR